MSVVTNIIFTFSLIDKSQIKKINEWLNKEEYGILKNISNHLGKYRSIECIILAGAFNHFNLEDFIILLTTLEWNSTEDVQLFIKEHEDNSFRLIDIFKNSI